MEAKYKINYVKGMYWGEVTLLHPSFGSGWEAVDTRNVKSAEEAEEDIVRVLNGLGFDLEDAEEEVSGE